MRAKPEMSVESLVARGMDREEAEAFFAAFGPEDLDPELVAHRYVNEQGWTVIHHPLVVSTMHHDSLNRMVNATLRGKRADVARAVEEEDWATFVYLHERPYRHHAFRTIAYMLDDEDYWDLLSSIWHDSENLWQWGDDIREFLCGVDPEEDAAGEWGGVLGDRPGRAEGLMDEVDARAFALLDDEVLVYRGYSRRGTAHGWSWTTDHLRALWFARRFTSDLSEQHLAVGRVRKHDVIAYTQRRGESEVIVDPDDVYGVEEVALSPTCECGIPVEATQRMGADRHRRYHRTGEQG